jgi:hypothetical protein
MTYQEFLQHKENCETCTSPATLTLSKVPHVLRHLPASAEELTDCQYLALFMSSYVHADGLPPRAARRYRFQELQTVEDFLDAILCRELVSDLSRLLRSERRRLLGRASARGKRVRKTRIARGGRG